jgi:hypothetical protein
MIAHTFQIRLHKTAAVLPLLFVDLKTSSQAVWLGIKISSWQGYRSRDNVHDTILNEAGRQITKF